MLVHILFHLLLEYNQLSKYDKYSSSIYVNTILKNASHTLRFELIETETQGNFIKLISNNHSSVFLVNQDILVFFLFFLTLNNTMTLPLDKNLMSNCQPNRLSYGVIVRPVILKGF